MTAPQTVAASTRFCWDCSRPLQSGKGVAVVGPDGRAHWVHQACKQRMDAQERGERTVFTDGEPTGVPGCLKTPRRAVLP